MGAGGLEAAQTEELHARTAFHPPQGWSLVEVETACSSISVVEEPVEKMEPSKMAPLKNAPRDALVSARGAGPGALGGIVFCETGQTERLAGAGGE